MSSVAQRLHTVEEYYFSRKLKELRALLSEGKPIINLGIGSPDLPPPPQVIEALNTSLSDATAHKYQSYQGLPELRMAISDFPTLFPRVGSYMLFTTSTDLGLLQS